MKSQCHNRDALKNRFSIGLDFGTESARAVLVELQTGAVAATAVAAYADGVIDSFLPGSTVPLPPDWALQNPADWMVAVERLIPDVLSGGGVDAEAVAGVGVDFTSCTILPTDNKGTPLSALGLCASRPHAWAKLWKHHAAQPQADRINAVAARRQERWIGRYGGKLSSEWLLPKALQMLEEDSQIYRSADRIVEGADWVVWQLTGRLQRNACAAGYKACWHKREGYPSEDFLRELHPELTDLFASKLTGPVLAPGSRAAGLLADWAARLGLREGTPVAVPIIDAHAAASGGGVTEPGQLFMIMGTSTCHLLIHTEEVPVEGIAGVVEDGIAPGFFGYEAGQAAVGDIFAWFTRQLLGAQPMRQTQWSEQDLHEQLSAWAEKILPGESGLLALDWWNGNRSTLADADLSGLILGVTLHTRPEEIYRALIEATAFGTRVVIDAFAKNGVRVSSIVAGGGLTKNGLLMQIYADVTGSEIAVCGSEQVSALGAAMLAAVAAGPEQGGFSNLEEAAERMVPAPRLIYSPNPSSRAVYGELYREYLKLYDYFGRGANPCMKILRELSRPATKISGTITGAG